MRRASISRGPSVLHRAGKLEVLYTDFWATVPWRGLGQLDGKCSLTTRYHPDLKDARVRGFKLQTLKTSRQHFTNPYDGFLKVGEAFGRSVASDLALRIKPSAFPLALDPRRSTLDLSLTQALGPSPSPLD